MELWLPFVQGFLFSLSLCCDLGIVNVAIIKTGMERGFKPSFMIGFGSCFGDLFYLSLALLGVSVIFEIAVIKWLFWIIGSGVLFYFTYKMFRETWRPRDLPIDAVIAAERPLFRDCLLVRVLPSPRLPSLLGSHSRQERCSPHSICRTAAHCSYS
ncbi:LysE family translocator [Paenibacillus sp. MCAF20]